MRQLFKILLCLSILFGACKSKEKPKVEKKCTAYVGATVIDGRGNKPKPNQVLIIKGDKIIRILPADDFIETDSIEVVNVKDKFIIPGLIDMHAHVTVLPIDENNAIKDSMDIDASIKSLKTILQFGITTVRNPAAPLHDVLRLKTLTQQKNYIGPEVYSAGNPLNKTKAKFGPLVAVTTEKEVREEVMRQAKGGVDFIKVYATLSPKLTKIAIDEAHKQGLKVIGHLQQTTWTQGAEFGIDAICHAAPWSVEYLPVGKRKGYRPTFLGRLFWLENVNYQSAQLIEMAKSMAKNNVIFDPTLITFHTKFWGDDSMYTHTPDLKLVHPTILNVWNTVTFTSGWTEDDYKRAKKQWKKLLALTKLLYDEGVIITTGSDFPNPWVLPGLSLHQEMKLLTDAGIPPLEVIKCATYNGAAGIGIGAETGSIEVGKKADFVVLEKNPLEDINNTKGILLIVKEGKQIVED
jgi:imidazolonepropionase-like amidohydrolase